MTSAWEGDLAAEAAAALGEGGAASRVLTGFIPRPQQLQMAQAVSAVIEQPQALVLEAGTGTGKTFGYLVPALMSGKRVLISSATKALQDQLFGRDLPDAIKALGLPVQAALLKGRANYLCIHRLEQSRHQGALPDRLSARAFAKVEQWAQRTKTGDLAELPGLDDRSPVIPLVTSSRDNCLGSECSHFQACHVVRARREAMSADVVVINHHLFFADLSLRESGMAELLPTVDVLVFDEAHQLPEAGVQFLGSVLSSAALQDLARDVIAAGLQHARGLADWSSVAAALDKASRDWRLAVGPLVGQRTGQRLAWPQLDRNEAWLAALGAIADALEAAKAALNAVSEVAPDFARLVERCDEQAAKVSLFGQPTKPRRVRWLDVSPMQVRAMDSPLDIRDELGHRATAGDKTWVFTSATLGESDSLEWFTQATGLEDATTLRVSSPFDYPRQAALHVPAPFAAPNSPEHPRQVAQLVADLAGPLRGRSFVLTTTLRALQQVAQHLREAWKGEDGWGSDAPEVLVQGETPKRLLLQRFRELNAPGGRGAVLVGSASFWEGIDVAGESLQLVVIDKLPFPPPNDPLVEARTKAIQADGGNPFKDYYLAEAALSLKQGAGRLIRRETDRGLLVVTDPRLRTASYGKRLLDALPPMQRLGRRDDAVAYVRALAAGEGGIA